MLLNYLKIALRNLYKYKYYSTINIIGLAVGLACFLLIMLFVQHELSYDRYHDDAENIYRVAFSGSFGGGDLNFAGVAAGTASALLNDFPEINAVTRIYTQQTQRRRVSFEDKTFIETQVAFADASLFDIFTIPLLSGNQTTALAEPNTLILSEKMARKYFGNQNPLGKILNFDAKSDYKVTGVFKEIPANTHFHYDFIAALTTLEESRDIFWLNNMSFRTYIKINDNADPIILNAKFPDMVRKYCVPMLEQYRNQKFEDMQKNGLRLEYYLQPVADIHLHSDLSDELEPNSEVKYIYIFSAIAFFILIIACINFMNISTACSANRAKEVGIRKVVGSIKSQLVTQFLAESIILSFIALSISILIVMLALPHFNNLTEKELSINLLLNSKVILSILAIIFSVGLFAGSYPAFFLSAFKPITVLKQKLTTSTKGQWLRSGLVIFQFVISMILIVGTTIIYKQLNYVQNKKLGFNKEQTLVIHDAYILDKQTQSFKNELLEHPEITNATISSFLPVTSRRLEDIVKPQGDLSEKGAIIQRWFVDYDYVETMDMKIVQGRDFSKMYSTDSTAAIVNEAAAKHFGWDNPIGKLIHKNDVDYYVVGVVEDFHFESLREHISPLVLFVDSSENFVTLRLNTAQLSQTLKWIEAKWNSFAAGQPFEFSFLDDRFNKMYKAEQKVGSIIGLFAGLAIFIGCLGLFGLAAFTTEQRTKEIGIRKVLGSSITGIILLVTKQFAKWIIFAIIIACPIAYFMMKNWLQDFAYRTEIDLTTFIFSSILTFIIAFLTVSYQAVKAARANPVKALQYE